MSSKDAGEVKASPTDTQELRENQPWQSEEILRELYHRQGLTQAEVADELGCVQRTVCKWINRHGLEITDPRGQGRTGTMAGFPAAYTFDVSGSEKITYTRWFDGYANKGVRVHRLLAVAKYGFDAVCDRVVHHVNEIGWDNRPSNIALMDKGEHSSYHTKKQRRAMTDGGVAVDSNEATDSHESPEEQPHADLSDFQTQALIEIANLQATNGEVPYGLAIKERLEAYYGETQNHGRLYPNLDTLADRGLITKGDLDRRTHTYELTAEGRRALVGEYNRLDIALDVLEETDVAGGEK